MPTPVLTTVIFTLIPILAMIVGGLIAVVRPPSAAIRGGIQHFAAGVVFAVVAVELLPDLRSRNDPWEMAISFGLGVAVMLGLRKLTEGNENSEPEAASTRGLVVTVGVDLVIDGLLLGVGFAAGAKTGTLLALALSAECLSLGLATAAAVSKNPSVRRTRVVLIIIGLAVFFAVGAILGLTLLHGLSDRGLTWVLGFGCAALLYLVTEELLVEAHEAPETPVGSAMFFVGFLLFLILGMFE